MLRYSFEDLINSIGSEWAIWFLPKWSGAT